MKQITIIAIILGILVLVSVVQAFQLNGLKQKVDDAKIELKSDSGSSSSGGTKTTASLPSSVKNLPQMVGGC